MKLRRAAGIVLVLLALACAALIWFQKENLYDWYKLRNYTPPQRIVELADDTDMMSYTRRVFYANHPEVNDKEAFNQHCRENEQTIVLGCFIENQGIFLLKVDDPRLNGVEEVTAAHETLHAIYARLGRSERSKLDGMLTAAFNRLSDEQLKNTVELYRKKDPKVVPNELHSILGTEIRNLPADLEAHYAKYFIDRTRIVEFAEKYNQVFIDERNQVIEYDAQLQSLKTRIETLEKELGGIESDLDSRRNQLNAMKSQGQFEQYNAAVPPYNTQVNTYNAKADVLRGLIAQYNAIIPKRNAIANEQQELAKAIDSREVPSASRQ